jgi:hypothetical protein
MKREFSRLLQIRLARVFSAAAWPMVCYDGQRGHGAMRLPIVMNSLPERDLDCKNNRLWVVLLIATITTAIAGLNAYFTRALAISVSPRATAAS